MNIIAVYERASDLRDACMTEMSRCASDVDLVADGFDPGDAYVDLKGNPHNVLTVLAILDAIGIPGCRAR